jgi:2'-5' RNA ligase
MQTEQEYPLILTLRLDDDSQAFFNQQRKQYFPVERNYLDAHLTLFHQLPNLAEVADFIRNLDISVFDLQISGLRNLGAGVAYLVESPELHALRKTIAARFLAYLIPQDQQGFRPHITIMNKSTPEQARKLLAELSADFHPFSIKATGLDLWVYLGGPWRHEQTFGFT